MAGGESETAIELLRETRAAELALIEAEAQAEEELVEAERRYREALAKLAHAQERVETRRKKFDQARALLDQRQMERAAGPLLRRSVVARPSLPRPARDDSRIRSNRTQKKEPASEDASPISNSKESENSGE